MFATVPNEEKVEIPLKNGAIIGFLTWISGFTQT
jgi:hypothetical protein